MLLYSVHSDVVARPNASVVLDACKVQAYRNRGIQRPVRCGRAPEPKSAQKSGTRSGIAIHWRRERSLWGSIAEHAHRFSSNRRKSSTYV